MGANDQSVSSPTTFLTGLVFGFDVGTGSIGYAVRKGEDFKDVGVLICDSGSNDLSTRRGLRRQRRTLRSRKYRRQWFAEELIKLGLTKPNVPPSDPISLRLRALKGEFLKPEELHAALTHLFKRRGYSKVPWANVEAVRKNGEKAKQEESDTQKIISELEREMRDKGCKHPCQLLDLRRTDAGKLPQKKWGRNFPWGRQMLENEFRAIVEAQKMQFPELAKNAETLLHCNTQEVTREIDGQNRKFHVYFKTDKINKPGVLAIRWPKFENRDPGLDALEPFRKNPKTGAWVPQHTLRRDKLLFKEWQLEVALNNFRVKRRQINTGRSKKEKFEFFPPPSSAMASLRRLWNERGHLWAEDLQEWAKAYDGQFELHYPDRDLTPRNNLSGRARFSKHGMAAIRKAITEAREKHDAAYNSWEQKFKEKNQKANEEDIANGYARFLTQQISSPALSHGTVDSSYARTVAPPPVLILPDETTEDAFQRYLNAIRNPQVRHRVELFGRELRRLMKLHNHNQAPDFIIIEMARDLMMNQEQKDAKEAKDKERRDERDKAAQILRDMGFAPDADNIKKFLLAQEVGWRCPFTLQPFCQSDFSNLTITQLVQAGNRPQFVKEAGSVFDRLEVEHLVPRTPVVCNEWFNLTVTLHSTNAQKRKRTPFQWLSVDKDGVPADLNWERACKNAAERFGEKSLKYQVFASANPAQLIEDNAKRSIQQTAYIARCLREACLILFGKEWLDWNDGVGRDPRLIPNNRASRSYLTTSGTITARLRDAWHLNEILWPKLQRLDDTEWNKLTDEEKAAFKVKYKEEREARALKNRQDHRHHAIDAMVISCAMPWQAFTPRLGNKRPDDGLCELDAETGEIKKIWNPVFNDYGHGIMRAAESKRDLLLKFSAGRKTDLLRHHKSNQRNAQAFDTTPYGRREKFGGDEIGQTLFVARKRMLDLKTSHLDPRNTGGFIFSPLLREHIAKEWELFSRDEANWLRVQSDWIKHFEGEISVLRASGKDDQKTRAGIKAREARIYKLNQMAAHRDWDDLLCFVAKELGAQQPQPRFPSQFTESLRHPIYATPIASVKVTAQSKDDDSFLLVRQPTSEKARSGTYVMRKQENKYREMRVYRLPKPGRSGAYACWLLLPWYGQLDSRGKRFKKVENDFITSACKGAAFIRTFRRDEIVCFANNHLSNKGIKQNESWRIVRTDAKGDFLANVGLLPANLVRETAHPITGQKVKLEPVVVALNDFMKALDQNPSADELPHPPSIESQSESPHQA
jgi:CRISPR-associated endonuclease Csn1